MSTRNWCLTSVGFAALLASCSGDAALPAVPNSAAPGATVDGAPAVGDAPALDETVTPVPVDTAEPTSSACVPRRVRPLNGAQYKNTIVRSFPSLDTTELNDPYASSDRSAEFSTDATIRRFDFGTSNVIRSNARTVADSAAADVFTRFPCLSQSADAACVSDMVTQLSRELFRAPAGEQQGKLIALFDGANAAAGVDAAVKLVVRAMLSSPSFLFRRELGQPTADGSFALTAHELAESISYTLTNAPPDAALNAAADSGMLAMPGQVREHALRLVSTGGRQGMTEFILEMLNTRDIAQISKEPTIFPEFDGRHGPALAADFEATIDDTYASSTPTLEHLLTRTSFVVRPETAGLLGWGDPESFAETGTLYTPTEPGRIGIMTHPAVMASYAHPDETSPVSRGHLVSEKLLCITVPELPPGIEFPELLDDGVPRTLRQVLEAQHSIDNCAACHKLMDPFGFPFEVFDAVGRLRQLDNGIPIDSSGEISNSGEIDGPVQGTEDMLQRIATSEQARQCFADSVVQYVSGGQDVASCGNSADIYESFALSGGNIPELFVQLLESPVFTTRFEAPPPATQ